MKRLIASVASTVALLVAGLGGSFASAANGSWFLNVSQLSSYTTSHSFNVQYTVLSTVQGTNFCVQLFQDGNPTALATQNTLNPSDSNTQYGNSGTFPVTVAADGTYSYTVTANMDNCLDPADTPQSGSTTTKVDTVAPGAPNYLGKAASGSNTVVNFTAPSDSDVATVNIYASSSKTYSGDNAHLLKTVAVSPGQTYHETVNASSSLFFSVQAFDNAGNGSSIVGDPGTVVNPVRFVNNGVTAGGTGGGGAATTGQVLGVSTGTGGTSTTGNGTNQQGNVNAPGSSKTNKSNNNGKVLGVETTKNSNSWWQWTGVVIVVLFVLGLLYRLFFWKTSKP